MDSGICTSEILRLPPQNDVVEWLQALGLSRYVSVFVENAIDELDLVRDLGVTPFLIPLLSLLAFQLLCTNEHVRVLLN